MKTLMTGVTPRCAAYRRMGHLQKPHTRRVLSTEPKVCSHPQQHAQARYYDIPRAQPTLPSCVGLTANAKQCCSRKRRSGRSRGGLLWCACGNFGIYWVGRVYGWALCTDKHARRAWDAARGIKMSPVTLSETQP